MNRFLAREKFLASGQVHSDTPLIISESRNRSLAYKVDLHLSKSPKVLNPMDTQEQQTSSLLYDEFQTIIPKIKSFSNSNYSFLLADNQARLLGLYAKEDLMELLKTFNAVPGGVWSEELCGTTLAAGKSVVIHDAQHFCESWQVISYAGVPILDPINRKIIGVLNLTCFPEDFPTNAVELTETLAKSLEMEVFNQLQIHRLYLENAYLEKDMRSSKDILLVVNLEGQIIRCNDSEFFKQQDWSSPFDWYQFFQMNQEQSVLSLSALATAHERPLPFSTDSSGGDLQFIYYKDRIIGALIQMRRQPEGNVKKTSSDYKSQSGKRAFSTNDGMSTVNDAIQNKIIGESP